MTSARLVSMSHRSLNEVSRCGVELVSSLTHSLECETVRLLREVSGTSCRHSPPVPADTLRNAGAA
jgi:hypothetical protein